MTINILPQRTNRGKTRPIRIEGSIAYVPLTRGFEAIIDAHNVPLVEDWSWRAHVKKNVVYARCSVRVGGVRRHICMHQVIMPVADDLLPDHRNGNGLDNREDNLRIATKRANGRNVHRRCPDHRIGVRMTRGRFEAWVYVGKFSTKDEANSAARRAEEVLGLS